MEEGLAYSLLFYFFIVTRSIIFFFIIIASMVVTASEDFNLEFYFLQLESWHE
jgi:hypothetical protein